MEQNKDLLQYIKKISYFIAILFTMTSTLIFILNEYVLNQNFTNGETKANLLITPKNTSFKYCILGISHGRSLSDGSHHQLFENIYGKTINLAVGNSLSGLRNQRLYLEHFFAKGNKVDSIIVVLSPTLLYNPRIDESTIAFYKEPIEWNFLMAILSHNTKNRYAQAFHYVKSKLSQNWWRQERMTFDPETKKLDGLDKLEVKKGFDIAYPKDISKEEKKVCEKDLSSIISYCEKKGCKIIFFIPPALFGQWPNHKEVISHLSTKHPSYKLIDASEWILDAKYYRDHHHLNTEGIKLLLSKNSF